MLSVLPRERRTFLFSATMTSKVAKLQRASLKNPARVSLSEAVFHSTPAKPLSLLCGQMSLLSSGWRWCLQPPSYVCCLSKRVD